MLYLLDTTENNGWSLSKHDVHVKYMKARCWSYNHPLKNNRIMKSNFLRTKMEFADVFDKIYSFSNDLKYTRYEFDSLRTIRITIAD